MIKRKTETGRERQQVPETMPPDNPYPISQKNNTYCEQCLLGTTLLYFYIHVPSNLELNQRRHRRYPLWPGMTWNGMLKYVHCSKYSPSVSRLQLFLISVLLCLVVSFGICSHFQSKKKKKETEQDGGWCARSATNVTLAFPVIFEVELCYRCWTELLVRNEQWKSHGHAPS